MGTITISKIKANHKAKGYHFFDTATMRCFGSRIESRVINGCLFITSEQDNKGWYAGNEVIYVWNRERRYTIMRYNPETCAIDSVSEFGQYSTKAEAIAAAKAMICE